MPIVRERISIDQLAELLGVEAWRLRSIEVNLLTNTAAIVLEPEEDREWRLVDYRKRPRVA